MKLHQQTPDTSQDLSEANPESRSSVVLPEQVAKRLAQLTLAVEASPSIVLITDAKGIIEYVNPRFTEVTGYTAVEVIGRNAGVLGEPTKEEAANIWATLNAGRVWRGEFSNRKKDGTRYCEAASISSIKNEKGVITHFVKVAEDITERKLVEEKLERSRAELRIRNRITDIFLTVPDEEMYGEVLNVILEATQSKYGVFGYIADDGALVVPSMTRDIWDQCRMPEKKIVFPRETWGDSIWPRTIRQKKTFFSNEPSSGTPEGHIRILRNISVPLIDQGEAVGLIQVANKETDYDEKDVELLEAIAGSIAPILTARLERNKQEESRRRAEEALRRAHDELELRVRERTAELEASNKELKRKIAELDEFTFVASHDLREPLRKIVAFTDLLRKDLGDDLPPDAKTDLGFIIDAAERMQMLIDHLLAFSRAGSRILKRETVRLHECVDAALEALHVLVNEMNAEIVRDRLPEVMGDRVMLTQLYQNLIGNALKFTSEERPVIHLTVETLDKKMILGVKDNGIGIKPEYFEKVFMPFRRLHGRGKYEGTGIGLAICRKVVERHGGRIWVESEPGKGSHFRFTLNENLPDSKENLQCKSPMENPQLSCSPKTTPVTSS